MALVQVNYLSKALNRTVTFHAIIPTDNDYFSGPDKTEGKPYRTLYLLNGLFGNYTDWVCGTRIEKQAMEKNLAVIMPSGDNSYYVDNPDRRAMYGEFIGEELVEATRRMFHLSRNREDTFLAGLSMGGYGAIRNGLKYSPNFSRIAALSAVIIPYDVPELTEDHPMFFKRKSYIRSVFGNTDAIPGSDMDPEALVDDTRKRGLSMPGLYLACGTEDPLISHNRRFRDFLAERGVPFAYEESPGIHDWVFWDKYIGKALDWLLLPQG